jgi:aminoglycoside 3-N-acetyltransferase
MKKYISKLIPDSLKVAVRRFSKARKFEEFKKNAVGLDVKTLVEGFKKAGFEKGDVLFIHSSLRSLGYIENGAVDIINALKEVVGEEGTLVFPAFTINGSMYQTLADESHIFDPKKSVATTGKITNVFWEGKDVCRSIHPTHSVAAWGKHARFITEGHHKAETNFGKGTPFGNFLSLKGKIVGIGISYGPVTFYHVYEDLNLSLFPDVYLKDRIPARYKLENGEIASSSFLSHNPEFHQNRIDKVKDKHIEDFFARHFEANNLSQKVPIGQGSVWSIKSDVLISELEKLHKKNITIYSVDATKK